MIVNLRVRQETTRIILHDSLTEATLSNPLAYIRWRAHALGLLDIGYHYLILPDGSIVKGRDHRVLGSHTPGHNHDSIGVCLIGGKVAPGHGLFPFTSEQLEAVRHMATGVLWDYPEPLKLVAHSEVQRYRMNKDRIRTCPALDMRTVRDASTPSQDGAATQVPA